MKSVNEYKLLSNHDYFTDINGKKELVHIDNVSEGISTWLPFRGRRTKKIAHFTHNGKKYSVDAKGKFFDK